RARRGFGSIDAVAHPGDGLRGGLADAEGRARGPLQPVVETGLDRRTGVDLDGASHAQGDEVQRLGRGAGRAVAPAVPAEAAVTVAPMVAAGGPSPVFPVPGRAGGDAIEPEIGRPPLGGEDQVIEAPGLVAVLKIMGGWEADAVAEIMLRHRADAVAPFMVAPGDGLRGRGLGERENGDGN